MDGTGPGGYNIDIQDADGWDPSTVGTVLDLLTICLEEQMVTLYLGIE